MRRRSLILALTFVMSLVVSVAGAQAIVVDDAGAQAGVSIVPSERGNGLPAGVSAVTSGSPCTDPWLSSDLWSTARRCPSARSATRAAP